jgi:hypothetical protein
MNHGRRNRNVFMRRQKKEKLAKTKKKQAKNRGTDTMPD